MIDKEKIVQHMKQYQHKYYMEHREYYKEYYKKHKEKINQYRKDNHQKYLEYKRKYYHGHIEESKQYQKANYRQYLNYKRQWEINNPEKRKEISVKQTSKRRLLGFSQINKPFKDSEGHHINKNDITYIPKELHQSVSHSIKTGRNMKEMNKLAIDFILKVRKAEQ